MLAQQARIGSYKIDGEWMLELVIVYSGALLSINHWVVEYRLTENKNQRLIFVCT